MPTEMHKEKWRDFEQKLNFRANFAMVINVITNLMWFIFNKSRVKMSQEFIASGKCDCNEEVSMAILPVVDKIIICGNILKLLFVITSYWKPGICKAYLLVQTLYYASI